MRIIEEYRHNDTVAYLKEQNDGRYTINVGSKYDSGSDLWFSTEATNEESAKGWFREFLRVWFSDKDYLDKIDELNDMDIYKLDSKEIEEYE